jgi:hypothetical protein
VVRHGQLFPGDRVNEMKEYSKAFFLGHLDAHQASENYSVPLAVQEEEVVDDNSRHEMSGGLSIAYLPTAAKLLHRFIVDII